MTTATITGRAKDKELSVLYGEIVGREKVDYVSPRTDMKMSHNKDDDSFKIHLGNDYDFEMNDFAIDQLSSTIAPGFLPYSRWLRQENKFGLMLDNVNRTLAQESTEKKAQIRTETKTGGASIARAVLSDAFKAIDDDVVFGVALPVISSFDTKFMAIGGNRTDIRSYLKIVSRDPVFSVQSGSRERAFHVGFMMRNSEVGRGFCEFVALLIDSFCQNGCIFSSKTIANVKYAHRGTRISTDFGPVIEDRFKLAEMASIKSTIADATRMVCQRENYDTFKQLIEAGNERRITSDTSTFLEEVGKKVGITKDDVEKVKIHINGDEQTQLGVQAAITRLAQDANNYDKRVELEEAGGKIMQMNDPIWNSINALAANKAKKKDKE